jgi:hypothetical protein
VTVEVESYSGYKADERPVRFQLGDGWLAVEEVTDRWYDPDAVYFKVRAGDGNVYILRHREPEDTWTLEAFRRSQPQ